MEEKIDKKTINDFLADSEKRVLLQLPTCNCNLYKLEHKVNMIFWFTMLNSILIIVSNMTF